MSEDAAYLIFSGHQSKKWTLLNEKNLVVHSSAQQSHTISGGRSSLRI